jgi:hypothetical protein
MPIPLSSNITISSNVLAQEINSETVLLDLQSESYFGLDAVGTRIWQLLQEHSRLQKVFDILLEEYNVTSEQLKIDIEQLLTKLNESGLITLEPEHV